MTLPKVTILFSGHDLKFLTPLIKHCDESPAYRVLLDEHAGHQISDQENSARLAADAQIIFCEWALGNAVWYSRHKRPGQILVVRLHLQEMDLPYLRQIDWDAVDHLILICPENQIELTRRFPSLESKAKLIYNPIPCDELDQPKLLGAEFNLGFVGVVPMRKRADLAVDILLQLKKIDRRYSLYFKGRMPHEYPWMQGRKQEKEYYERFYETIDTSVWPNAMSFDPYGEDVATWFRKIGFVLSTSDFEGSHQAVAEGMASGAIPIIRDWAGADKLYPSKYVYTDVEEAVELIQSLRQPGTYAAEEEECRKYARNHFDEANIREQYEQLFAAALREKGIQPHRQQLDRLVQSTQAAKPSVVHVCFLKPGVESGYRSRVITEVNLLTQRGHSVYLVVYTPRERPAAEMDPQDFAQELADNTGAAISVVETDCFFDLTLDERSEEELLTPVLAAVRECDAKILHGQALYAARIALRAAEQRPDLRVIFDCHGITPEETFMSGGHHSRTEALEKLEADVLRSADRTILVSERMREHFQSKYGCRLQRDLIVPCCVDVDRFEIADSVREDLRAELGISEKFVLGYLGTLASWQWPTAMFNLYSSLCRIRDDLHLMLLIPESDHAVATRLLAQANIPESRRSIREVPYDQVGRMLSVFDVGLLLREAHPVNDVSSPTKFGEYLAAGVPVIATSGIGDFSDWIAAGETGLVLRPSELDDTSYSVMRVSEFLDAVGQNRREWKGRCRKICEEKLAWESRIEEISEAYRSTTRIA